MAKERKEKKEKKAEKAEKAPKASKEEKKVDAGNDSDMEVDTPVRAIDISPIAAPLAADKLTKKLLKTVKKGNTFAPDLLLVYSLSTRLWVGRGEACASFC
jgi:H/ACA ribonucleoprotein complex subunit 2